MSGPAKLRLHVNRHVIASNRKRGEREPIYRLKVGRDNIISKTDSIELHGHWRVVYSPDKPLSCGAVAWIECVEGQAVVDRTPAGCAEFYHYYPKETV
jgi:hypothetical protein